MTADLHTLVGAFALDALDPVERDAFESHLVSCDTCQLEAAELTATAARLGSVAELQPSAAMRARVLDAVARTPQQRPNVVPLHEHRSSRWTSRGLLAAAAVLAVVGAGVGIDQYQENQKLESIQEAQAKEEALIADVLAADDKVAYGSETGDGLHLSVVASREIDAAVVSLSDLPALPEGRNYQVWRFVDGKPQSAGVMDAGDISRDTATMLMDDAADAEAVAVTEEPAGGSEQPTSDPLVSVEISA
jgi:anti-sigma factor RsiW